MGSKLIIAGFVSGSLFLAVSLLVIFYQDKFIHKLISKQVQLYPGSQLYKDWLNPPFDAFMKFYLYNLKNGPDFLNGSKPVFEEVGPFIYREYRIKEDIQDNLNFTITYKERKQYVFAEDLSPYKESYSLTTINVAAMTVINFVHHTRRIEHRVVNTAFDLTGETLIVTKSAGEILWGYEDKFLSALRSIVPGLVPSAQVGLMIGQNATVDGEYTVFTGVDDISKIGLIQRYNRLTSVSNWPTKYANMINGTDGTLTNPFVDKSTRQYAFQSNFCRSLYGVYNKSMTLKDDIELWGFGANEYIFANASVNPENADYCTPPGNCLGAGLINMTECLKLSGLGLPIIISAPHFLFGDEAYLKAVDGITPPSLDLHNTLLFVEPLTGLVMKANQRLQFNINCINDSNINAAKGVQQLYFPIMWADECFEVDDKTIAQFYNQVKLPLRIINIGKYAVLAVGSVLLVIVTVFVVIKLRKKRDSQRGESKNWISNETLN